MVHEKKQYQLTLMGDTYSVVSEESEEHIRLAAQLVDSSMHEIAGAAQHMPHEKVALLAALRMASRALKHEETLDEYRQQHEALLRRIDRLLNEYTPASVTSDRL